MTHRLTWAAILVCFGLTVPGLLVGWLAAVIYQYILSFYLASGTLFDWIGLEIVTVIALEWFPALLQGLIGGYIAVAITGKLFKHANYKIVAITASILIIGLSVLVGVTLAKQNRHTAIPMLPVMIGTFLAYSFGKRQIEEEQRYRAVASSEPTVLKD